MSRPYQRLVELDAEIFELRWALWLLAITVGQRGYYQPKEWAEMRRLAEAKNAAEAERLQLVRGLEVARTVAADQ